MADIAPQRLIDNMRGVRYGEVLAMFLRDTGLEAEVYGTQMLNDCPQELWETLDADVIAKDMGAVFVKLNGPRYWLLDGLGVNRGAVFFWDAGKPVYELVDPDGRAFILQARCVGVDSGMTEESLATLGDRLALPEGWSYRTRVLDAELVVDTSATLATVVQDEFENTYTLPY